MAVGFIISSKKRGIQINLFFFVFLPTYRVLSFDLPPRVFVMSVYKMHLGEKYRMCRKYVAVPAWENTVDPD